MRHHKNAVIGDERRRIEGRSWASSLAGPVSFIVARLCFCGFVLITSVYCLLAYIPFTYQWVIKFNLIWWLPPFVRFHTYIFWCVLAMEAAALVGEMRREKTRILAAGFIVAHVAAGLWLTLHPILTELGNDGTSYIWSLAWLFPLFWLSAIDYRANASEIEWVAASDHGRQTMFAAFWTALFVSTLYAVSTVMRLGADANISDNRGQLIGIAWSTASHLAGFALLFAGLKLINTVSRRFKKGAKFEFLLCHLLGGALAALMIRKAILPAIAFNNRLALFYSLAAGFSIAVLLMGISLRLSRRGEAVSGGLKMALTPVTLPGLSSQYGAYLWIAIALLFVWAVPAAVAMKDWDFLMQKFSAILIWPVSFAAFYQVSSRVRQKRVSTIAVAAAAVLILIVSRQIDPATFKIPFLKNNDGDISAAVDRYSAYDLSFRVLREISSEATDDNALYEYLREYTNILPSTRVAPVEINLVEQLRKSEGDKPNIFVFVVDSLRRDYLSPYNNGVNFTPRIAEFARDGVVMENAFTRYSGTALSEPAIWAGAMLLHKQYVLPFYPMNSLQRLLDTDEYQSFVSMDPILKELLRPSSAMIELDKRSDSHNFDFCWSLKELKEKIDQHGGSPIFAYTQPWNIHTHVIAVQGRSVVDGEQYPGFWAPYASRVKAMDTCFGEFIEYLKSRQLYDNSIVILTSDHGDAVGEDGRWGHSYWVYPETMRIPLIVHLPPKLQKAMTWNTRAPAFSTDITPSLYYLLGHRPIIANELFGRPLFTETEEEQRSYMRDSYVVASSYGAAYGVVSGDGKSLFVADAVKDKDYFFDLSDGTGGRLDSFTKTRRAEQKALIRDYIGAVNRFYNLNERPKTAGAFDIGWQGRPRDEQ